MLKKLWLCIFLCTPLASTATTQEALLKAADPDASGEYVRKRFVELKNKAFDNNDGRKKLLLVGDSHAQDFMNIIAESNRFIGYQIRTRRVPTQCQIYLGDEHARFILPKDKALCGNEDNLQRIKKQIANADLIIFASNWKSWAAKELPQTINHLNLKPEQVLIVIGRKNFGKVSIRHYLRMPPEKRITFKNPVDDVQVEINTLMGKNLPASQFIDMHKQLCGSSTAETCAIFTPNDELITFDGGHLTEAGAKYVGNILFTQTPLSKY
jgi:hypothetical protein